MCNSELHEADKNSPDALAQHYDAHAEPWIIDGESLSLFTCKRCRSTICVPVQS